MAWPTAVPAPRNISSPSARRAFTHWSVSYHKWTSALERTAGVQPETAWGAAVKSKWRDGSPIRAPPCLSRHTPEEREQTFKFAAVRFRKEGEMFWRYRFMACEGTRRAAAAIFTRYKLKGDKEPLLKEVLRGLLARVEVPASWLVWWEHWRQRWWPARPVLPSARQQRSPKNSPPPASLRIGEQREVRRSAFTRLR